MKKTYMSAAMALTLCASMMLGACSASGSSAAPSASGTETGAETETASETASPTIVIPEQELSEEDERFDEFCLEEFKESVSTDTLTLHFDVAHPENFGISRTAATLGDVYTEYNPEWQESLNELRETLDGFDYEKLSEDRQLTWDILSAYADIELSLDAEKLYYYDEPLQTSSGLHSILPILMTEYTFYSEEDVEDYLALLEDFPRYFGEILTFEQKKSEAGLFMSDSCLDEVISACEDFISDPENNVLLLDFPDHIAELSDLSEDKVQDYTDRNTAAVKESVIPAYETLIEGLKALRGTGTNEGGLSGFKDGRTYYSYLIRSNVGTDLTASEIRTMLADAIDDDLSEFRELMTSNKDLMNSLSSEPSVGTDDPVEMLKMLQEALKSDFPEAVTDEFTVNYVPEALEESLNPAFYIVPPVDIDVNTIYLNNGQLGGGADLFDTLAHEGYPGHLYQMTFFKSTDPNPVRLVMNFTGYEEGWATYVENYSYTFAGLDKDVARAYVLNQRIVLNVYGVLDVLINYFGYTLEDTQTFLGYFGWGDDETSKAVFLQIVGNPCSYLPYCVGSLQFQEFYDDAEQIAGDSFDPVEYHKTVLEIGPCYFSVLEDRLEQAGYLR
ncbi:MAG: DUF885 domain-containing protein [Lachnospiraceae bacterium]|nr:DUF885 domain-containing protein [Lachnospiraceae bacterium]